MLSIFRRIGAVIQNCCQHWRTVLQHWKFTYICAPLPAPDVWRIVTNSSYMIWVNCVLRITQGQSSYEDSNICILVVYLTGDLWKNRCDDEAKFSSSRIETQHDKFQCQSTWKQDTNILLLLTMISETLWRPSFIQPVCIWRINCQLLMNWSKLRNNRLNLDTLGFSTIMPKNLPGQCITQYLEVKMMNRTCGQKYGIYVYVIVLSQMEKLWQVFITHLLMDEWLVMKNGWTPFGWMQWLCIEWAIVWQVGLKMERSWGLDP